MDNTSALGRVLDPNMPQAMVSTNRNMAYALNAWPSNIELTHSDHMGSVIWVIIGAVNGLSLDWRQAIALTNADICKIEKPTSEILIKYQNFVQGNSCKKMSSAKYQPFYLGLIVFTPGNLVNGWLTRNETNGTLHFGVRICFHIPVYEQKTASSVGHG